jgi:hypothetical protein
MAKDPLERCRLELGGDRVNFELRELSKTYEGNMTESWGRRDDTNLELMIDVRVEIMHDSNEAS